MNPNVVKAAKLEVEANLHRELAKVDLQEAITEAKAIVERAAESLNEWQRKKKSYES